MGFEMRITGSDGKRYESLAEMVEAEGRQLFDRHTAAVKQAIERERCPVHNTTASAVVKRTHTGVRFEISACCEDLRDRAQAAAGRVQ